MCKHYLIKLEKNDRHYVPVEEFNNCVLCMVEEVGPMTQQEIADILGFSKMRICQIEKEALRKMKKEIKALYNGFEMC